MKLLFKYPTRGRPLWFVKTLDMYMRMLSGEHEVEFLIAMDTDDESMRNELMWDYLIQIEPPEDCPTRLSWYYKEHKGKVEAINSCVCAHDFDIVIPISDDVEPQEIGYDDIIARCMQDRYPDLDGVIYFNDGRTQSRIVGIPMMGRKMYVSRGHIIHPDFLAWGDNELSYALKKTGKLTYYGNILLRHCLGKYARMDATYQRAAHKKTVDRQTAYRLMGR